MNTDELSRLRNLGPKSSQMLAAAGIQTQTQLKALGPIKAYLAVKRHTPQASLNLLWAIEGALSDRDWKEVSRTERTHLLLQLEDLEQGKRLKTKG